MRKILTLLILVLTFNVSIAQKYKITDVTMTSENGVVSRISSVNLYINIDYYITIFSDKEFENPMDDKVIRKIGVTTYDDIKVRYKFKTSPYGVTLEYTRLDTFTGKSLKTLFYLIKM